MSKNFHPYFTIPHGQFLLKINDKEPEIISTITLSKEKAKVIRLKRGSNVVELDNHDNILKITLNKPYKYLYIWTDSSSYVCLGGAGGEPGFFCTKDGVWLGARPHGVV